MMAKRKHTTDDATEAEWSREEQIVLLDAINAQCPQDDRLSFTARLGKIDWTQVKVEGHSAQQCQDAWHQLSTKVRKFRLLSELTEDAKDFVLHPEKYQKKKIKHPDQPTRPLTAYFQFLQDHREEVRAQHPELKNVELQRLLSQEWQALSPSKQNKYIKKYKKRFAKFQEANTKFLEEHPELNAKHPKPQPPNPFNMFKKAKMAALKHKYPQFDNLKLMNKARKKYCSLSPEKKKKWIQRAFDAIPEYEEEVRLYQKMHPEFEPPAKKVRLTREEAVLNGDLPELKKKNKVKFEGAPSKPPRSAYQLFVKKKGKDMEGNNFIVKMAALSQQWKELGDKQQKYVKKLAKLKAQYDIDLAAFKQTLSEEDLAVFEASLKPAPKKKKEKEKKTEEKTKKKKEEDEEEKKRKMENENGTEHKLSEEMIFSSDSD